MKKLTLFFAITLLPLVLSASMVKMALSEAIKGKFVKMTAVNTAGNYTGKSVRLTITNNNKKDSINLTVNLGVILKPDDLSYQPMVLGGEETLVLEPGKKDEVDVEVFCGNSPKHCPTQNLHYSFLKMGSDTLVSVLRYINDHNLFDHLGQSAVWAITNNHPLAGVYDNSRDSLSKKLIDTISRVTGRPKPDYFTLTAKNTTPGTAAYNPKTLKIIAQFDVTLKTATLLTVGVFDVREHMIEKTFERTRFERGHHNIEVNFDAEAYGAGKYIIRLMDAEKVLQEKKVVAEE